MITKNTTRVIFVILALLSGLTKAACTVTSMTPNPVAIDVTSALNIYGTFSGSGTVGVGICALSNPAHCTSFSPLTVTTTTITKPTITWTIPFGASSYFPGTVTVFDSVLGNCNAGTLSIKTPTLITVTPSAQTLTTTQQQQYAAIVTYDDASTQNVSTLVTWASSNTSVATINATGMATAVTAGATDITASLPGVTSPNQVLTVTAAPSIDAVNPAIGPTVGGTNVTITGAGFTNATAVKFGAATATFTIDSATQITATAPAGAAGTVDITVTTPGGTSAISPIDRFTYQPAPAVTNISPNAGPLTSGTVITITGTNFTNGATVKFGNTPAASVTYNSDTSITVTAPAGLAGAVDITVTTTGGTSTTSAADRYIYQNAPVISSATTATTIQNAPFTYTIAASNTPTSFSANGLPSGLLLNASTGVISGTVATVGTTNIVIGATNAGGTDTATLALTVNPPAPVINSALTATATAGVNFNYQITASNSPASFSATNLPAGLTIDTATGIISGNTTAAVTVNVTLSATNISGTNSATLALTVMPAATANITLNVATQTLNIGNVYNLAAAAKDAYGNIITNPSIVWTSSDPNVAAVNPVTGQVTAGTTAGTANITAIIGAIASTPAIITVNPDAVVNTIIPSASSQALNPNGNYTLTIVAKDSYGNIIPNPNVTYTSSNPSVASVDPVTGQVTAGTAAGTATITITAGGVNTTVTITVNSGPASTVTLSPTTYTLNIGATYNLNATVKDVYDNTITNPSITWVSSNTSIATVDVSGKVTAGTVAGTANITATIGTITSTPAIITVNPGLVNTITPATTAQTLSLGDSYAITATATDSYGNAISNPGVTYTSSNPSIASVDPVTGQVTAGTTAGTATITISANGINTTVAITVNPGPVSTIALNTTAQTLNIGNTYNLVAVAKDAYGNIITNPGFTWVSSNSSVANVNTSGQVTAGTVAGNANITAAIGSIISTPAVITVTPGVVKSVVVTPSNNLTISSNSTIQFSAAGLDANNNTVGGTTANWSVTNGTGSATIDANGLLTGIKAGTVTVNAEINGVVNTINVTIDPGALFKLQISPNNPSIQDGDSIQFSAIGLDSNDNIIANTPITWSYGDPGDTGAVVDDGNGLVTSSKAGTVTVIATAGIITASVVLTVQALPVQAPVITSSLTSSATCAADFNYQIIATNNPTSFAAANLPAGLVVDLVTGIISGKPTTAGTYNIDISASNSGGSDQETLVLTIAPAPVSLGIASVSPNSAIAGSSVNLTITGSAFQTGAAVELVNGANIITANNIIVNSANSITCSVMIPSSASTGSWDVTVTVNGNTATKPAAFIINAYVNTLTAITVTMTGTTDLFKQDQRQFRAIGTYADGSTSDITSQVAWSSNNQAVININNQALATANDFGTANITASLAGIISNQVTLTVAPKLQAITIVAVMVDPKTAMRKKATTNNNSLTAPLNTKIQFTAQGSYDDDSNQDITNDVTWSSGNTDLLTINSNGAATTKTKAGNAVVSAALEQLNQQYTIIIKTNSMPPASIITGIIAGGVAIISGGLTWGYIKHKQKQKRQAALGAAVGVGAAVGYTDPKAETIDMPNSDKTKPKTDSDISTSSYTSSDKNKKTTTHTRIIYKKVYKDSHKEEIIYDSTKDAVKSKIDITSKAMKKLKPIKAGGAPMMENPTHPEALSPAKPVKPLKLNQQLITDNEQVKLKPTTDTKIETTPAEQPAKLALPVDEHSIVKQAAPTPITKNIVKITKTINFAEQQKSVNPVLSTEQAITNNQVTPILLEPKLANLPVIAETGKTQNLEVIAAKFAQAAPYAPFKFKQAPDPNHLQPTAQLEDPY